VSRPIDASQRAVFLDRDGVLNEAVVRNGRPHPPANLEEFVLLPGVVEACARLRRAGFALIVVTNQPDIDRGAQDANTVAAMHQLLLTEIGLDAIYLCPHDDKSHCECRKPAPGMLLAASYEHGLDLSGSFIVGDRWRDIEAGRRAGCRTIHVDRHYEELRPQRPDAVVADLPSAGRWIEGTLRDKEEVLGA
jgi:D-glycero-D-manno-heptose 1,7-bisphosphate phosphatase